MYFLLAWLIHFFGAHTPKPYSLKEDEKLIKQGKFRCCVCNKIFKKEE